MNVTLSSDQYNALNELEYWYRKGSHQFIDVSGPIYTGLWDVLQVFLEYVGLDPREVMYLSYDQRTVLDLAYSRYHGYYIYGKLYKYDRNVDLDSIPVINPHSTHLSYTWTKRIRQKIDKRYRLIVVLDASLLNERMLWDLSKYGLPVVLLRDPYLLPDSDSYIYAREPNVFLEEPSERMARNPVHTLAYSVMHDKRLTVGSFQSANVIRRKDLHMYNLKSSSMNLVYTQEMRNIINDAYRNTLKRNPIYTYANERVYVADSHYQEILVNTIEKKVKVYLQKGMTGTLTKVNRHAAITRYVPCEFQPDYYHEPFTELVLDRDYLLHRETKSRQLIPDDVVKFEYAYALTPQLARMNHWDDVTIIMEQVQEFDEKLAKLMSYTAITRAARSVTVVL